MVVHRADEVLSHALNNRRHCVSLRPLPMDQLSSAALPPPNNAHTPLLPSHPCPPQRNAPSSPFRLLSDRCHGARAPAPPCVALGDLAGWLMARPLPLSYYPTSTLATVSPPAAYACVYSTAHLRLRIHHRPSSAVVRCLCTHARTHASTRIRDHAALAPWSGQPPPPQSLCEPPAGSKACRRCHKLRGQPQGPPPTIRTAPRKTAPRPGAVFILMPAAHPSRAHTPPLMPSGKDHTHRRAESCARRNAPARAVDPIARGRTVRACVCVGVGAAWAPCALLPCSCACKTTGPAVCAPQPLSQAGAPSAGARPAALACLALLMLARACEMPAAWQQGQHNPPLEFWRLRRRRAGARPMPPWAAAAAWGGSHHVARLPSRTQAVRGLPPARRAPDCHPQRQKE